MLYVFHVDSGRMIKFDMNVALTSVQNLKDIIEKRHGLSADKVVLLVSGGEMLTSNSLVCSYSAGTDTNPIYMFTTVDIKPQPWPSIEPGHFTDSDLAEQVERCLNLPSAHSTIVASAQLGQQFYDLALEEETVCETLVHEQHLQQQGWSAVIANMEDLTEEFRQRFETFSRCFEEHLSKRNEHLELLQNFNQDLVNLSKIPILPSLLQNAEEEFHGFDEFLDNDDVFSRSQQNESMILQSTNNSNNDNSNNDVTSNERIHQGAETSESIEGGSINARTMITSSSGSSSVVEQKRPRLSKENTPETVIICSGIKSDTSTNSKAVINCRNLTLLQWISAKENHDALRVMAEECGQGLATFSSDKYEQLKNEVFNIIKCAEQEEIKEIKGLEDRLSGLEKLMFNLKKIVQDQGGHSTALQQSQNRTSRLGDPSILPDLCESHRGQLKVMLNNHKQIRDYRRRISKAKDELGLNLNKRLKFIVQIENAMSERDHSLLFYHRCQRRVERHINIIQQIHLTPKIYLEAVTEVVRRRIFSGEFVQWASNLACDFDAIHNEEVERRRQFNSKFEGHFLNILFPGMNDMPPAFANENPIIFDACLPNITKNDVDLLTEFLPNIGDNIQLPDMENVIDFFASRSGNKMSDQKMSTTQNELLSTNVNEIILAHRPIDLHTHLKDGFESETDTEEFEKVGDRSSTEGQSLCQGKLLRGLKQTHTSVATSTSENRPFMQNTSIETEPIKMNNAETLTEENLESNEKEKEKLKSCLRCMCEISNKCTKLLKENLQSLKSDQRQANEVTKKNMKTIEQACNLIQEKYKNQDRLITEAHQLETKSLLDKLKECENVIKNLKEEQNYLISSHLKHIECLETESKQLRQTLEVRNEEIEQLQNKVESFNAERIKALNELREKLIHEHKTELESLRCRFKIMTSMERSPSDTSLEKIEKSDMIDITCHESILLQTREDLNIEKEIAVKKAKEEFNIEKDIAIQEAIALERIKWEHNSSPTGVMAMTANMELLKKMVEEKDKQLDIMRERELMYSKDICQLKMKIEALTNDEESDKGWMKEKIDFLNRHNHKLEQELNIEKEKSKRFEMESSISTMRSSNIEQSMIRSKSSSSQYGGSTTLRNLNVSTDSCSAGDLVFVVWNIRHGQYIIVQESPNLFFVHADSLSSLNLKLPIPADIEIPVPFFTIAKVINKEFCQARKDENRYKVLKGTKFFRVKLQPVTEMKWHLRREKLEAVTSNVTSVSRSTSTQHLIDSFSQTETEDFTCENFTTSSLATTSSNCDIPRCDEINIEEDSQKPQLETLDTTSNRHIVENMSIKNRTLSASSFTQENEEPDSLLNDPCNFRRVAENGKTTFASPILSEKGIENIGMFVASPMSTENSSIADIELSLSRKLIQDETNTASTTSGNQIQGEKEQTDDSDEYRSLETKEDFVDFSAQAEPQSESISTIITMMENPRAVSATPSTMSINEYI
ncbi:RB1-inducible coiled-coil protein 1 [Condylostylus longicornis]|uniref:RB1-inducible coiled-coil protein 1 n=1 Tax=Condylostylus longicornis TaxID=2530218 RepID=UPI00244DEBC9|nr:RB1-inducible coiled-coil protein 1 [Condylostylus longicornis]XP_055381938.1 RB1-inducible coiled-coil protein 1 [Condylostylus longicornis]XP_055381939.1 RB1-inducible coiled-coil protein 1 [Condylostylus longicornis]XP_055381940.1 RB1-inducible coiled-coil protein 1 [Condylostylus longicornis]XP_055381941.1 RB1-inducible coiled-coil protein 1 [Condylostylus longicornis]